MRMLLSDSINIVWHSLLGAIDCEVDVTLFNFKARGKEV